MLVDAEFRGKTGEGLLRHPAFKGVRRDLMERAMTEKKLPCIHCDDSGWVCENHLSRPWRGFSNAVMPVTAALARRAAYAMRAERVTCRMRIGVASQRVATNRS